MIDSFADQGTEDILNGLQTKEARAVLPVITLHKIAKRKLEMIYYAFILNDLMVPPGNRLEKLKGNLQDFWSIRINDQWRIIFKWHNNSATDVQIVDYH